MRRLIDIFLVLVLATPTVVSAHDPCLTPCMPDDPECFACQYTTEGHVQENTVFNPIEVYAWEPPESEYSGDWCASMLAFDRSDPATHAEFNIVKGTREYECFNHSFVSTEEAGNLSLWYRTDAECGTLGDASGRYLGDMRIWIVLNSNPYTRPALCGEKTVYVDAEYASNWGGSTISGGCGGITVQDIVPGNEIVAYESDWTQLWQTTLVLYVTGDADWDFVANADDNCVYTSNPGLLDTNDDGFGNACDADFDDDGYAGNEDYGILVGCWGATPTDPRWEDGDPVPCIHTDMNGDNAVGNDDYGLFVPMWNVKMEDLECQE